jgi:Carbohydrate family 9 binding domain-like
MGVTSEPTMDGPRLTAQRVEAAPSVDGEIDPVWDTAPTLELPLTWGIRGDEAAYTAQLRAMYDDDTIYFLAQWPDDDKPDAGSGELMANKLTVHWTLPPPAPGLAAPACDVACHTAYADQTGRIVNLQAETIPPGTDEALPVAGAWRNGVWIVEWGRPLASDNANDLQFTDLDAAYPFFVKVFEGDAERADPVSPLRMMVFVGA